MILQEKIKAKSIYASILQINNVEHISPNNNGKSFNVHFYIKNIRLKSCKIMIVSDILNKIRTDVIVDNDNSVKVITDNSENLADDDKYIVIEDNSCINTIDNNYVNLDKTYTDTNNKNGLDYVGGFISLNEDFQIKLSLNNNTTRKDIKIYFKFIYYDYDGNLIIDHVPILGVIQHGTIEDYNEYIELYNIYNGKK